jgi:hypothetical protein
MKTRAGIGLLLISLVLLPTDHAATALNLAFAKGDVVVSLENGPVLWWLPDGTPNRVLLGPETGTGEGMAFDAGGNLYVARWCIATCVGGNTVEMFDAMGVPHGAVGSGYDCSPHTIVFDRLGNAYVGQAGCSKTILRFAPGMAAPNREYAAAGETAGVFWMDLAANGCTMFYTSYGPNVKRLDVCTGLQLSNFNAAPLPGGSAQDLRVLPDGGVIVSSGAVVARLNAAGVLVQTYSAAGESFYSGLDLAGDGTFWAGGYESSNVTRFDLASGAVVGQIHTNAPAHNVVGIRVKR